ncbi:MAG: nucleotidyl transferase AbiEii/AbiGii toxin family protein [Elusimicrobia bacterium]|nr:nucleotidyl transferase AbiEii/AbiGii toxin family protein [Elusimicrobiota bacterium]
MLDNLKNYLAPIAETQRLNRLREYLQWLILKSLDENGMRRSLVFVGGTALRVVYKTGRFSEDLDFSLTGSASFDPLALSNVLKRDILRYGLKAEITKLRTVKTVRSFFLKFQDLLHPLGLAPEENRALAIKLEVDTNPPKGGIPEEYFFADPVAFWVSHWDLPSLFAGKLSAFLFRKYLKGRDFYDLIFFLKKNTELNFKHFQNAVRQTNPDADFASLEDVFSAVRKKIEALDMKMILQDIRPFLLDFGEERYLTQEVALKLLEQKKDKKGDVVS